MNDSGGRKVSRARLLHWIARIHGLAVIAFLIVLALGEGGEPTSEEWVYLVFFPFGFFVGYLIGWRWPLVGGCVSLACMAISWIVVGRVFGWEAYLTWGVLSVPGVLFVTAGLMLRGASDDSEVPGSKVGRAHQLPLNP